MLKLPFHVDTPLAAGFAALAASMIALFLLWAYDRETSVGKALKWYFRRRFSAFPPEKAVKFGRACFVVLIVLFGAIALLGITVGSGLVQNGDPPRPLIDELRDKHGK